MEPILNLIAKPGVTPPQMTFTRASTATYVGPDGLIKTAKSNQLRYDYEPSTCMDMGWLLEETRTNKCLYSQDCSQGSYNQKINVTITPNSATSPDGSTTANLITYNTTTPTFRQDVSVSLNTVYTWSVFVKAGNCSTVALGEGYATGNTAYFSLSGIGSVTFTQGCTAGVTPYANGWYRCWMTMTTGGTYASFGCNVYSRTYGVAQAGDTIYVWGYQLEQGAFPTSYIPTTSATVTRSQDLSIVNVNMSSQSEFSVFLDYDYTNSITPAANQVILQLSPAVPISPSYNFTRPANVGRMQVSTPGVGACWFKPVDSNLNKLAYSINKTSAVIVENGIVMYNQAISYIPSNVTAIALGSNFTGGSGATGHIRRVQFWNQTLTTQKMIDITSPKFVNDLPSPSLNLAAKDGVTPPQLTVTRATTATYTDSNGLVKTALANTLRHDYDFSKMSSTTNLLQYSQDFRSTADAGATRSWGYYLGVSSLTYNTTATYAPDGTQTACIINPDTTNNYHMLTQTIPMIVGLTYTYSCYMKSAGATYGFLVIGGGNSTAIFNLLTGSVTYSILCAASMTSLGNGWYRCSITRLAAGSDGNCYIGPTNSPTAEIVTTASTDKIYIWGAQLEISKTPGTYTATTTTPTTVITDLKDSYRGWLIEESRTNSMLYSQDLSNTVWLKNGTVTYTNNIIAAPDGTSTGAVVNWNDTLGSSLMYTSSGGYGGGIPVNTAVETHVASFFAKAGTASFLLWNIGGSPDDCRGLNLVTGEISNRGGSGACGAIQYPNGWWRFWCATTNATSANRSLNYWQSIGSINGSYVAGSVYFWGFQFEKVSAFPTSYIPTTSAASTRSADVISAPISSFAFNSAEGTISTDVDFIGYPNDNTYRGLSAVTDASGGNCIHFYTYNNIVRSQVYCGVYKNDDMLTGSIGTPYRLIVAAKSGDKAHSYNGTNLVSNTGISTVNISTANQVYIGQSPWGTSPSCMHVKTFRYWAKRLSNSILQKITR